VTSMGDSEKRMSYDDLSSSGRSSFDWSVLCSALALAMPLSGVLAVYFADRSRRRGYRRWRSAFVMGLWCTLLGALIRIALLHTGVFP
jgi:hypothetical protein